jgi:hypothetical protein
VGWRAFADLRLELLGRGAEAGALRGALFGLLMLLPQADAFHALRNRLQCAPQALDLPTHPGFALLSYTSSRHDHVACFLENAALLSRASK